MGLLRKFASNRTKLRKACESSDFEQPADERDLAFDTRFLVMDMPAFDGFDGFNAAEGRLGRSQ